MHRLSTSGVVCHERFEELGERCKKRLFKKISSCKFYYTCSKCILTNFKGNKKLQGNCKMPNKIVEKWQEQWEGNYTTNC